MTISLGEDKQYSAFYIEWNDNDEEYEYLDCVTWNGENLQFATYVEFLEFMDSLSHEDEEYLGVWRLEHDFTGDYLTIVDGQFDQVNFLSLNAEKLEKDTKEKNQ